MGNKKVLTLLMLMVTLITHGASTAKAANHNTIQDIREEVKDGWHQTYEAHGRTIVVDIDIEIPDVNLVPAVCITFPKISPDQINNIGDNASDVVIDAKGLGYRMISSNHSILTTEGEPMALCGFEDRAENSSLSREEAVDFLMSLVNRHESTFGKQDLEIRFLVPYSRSYKILSRGRVYEVDWSKPVTETGFYAIELYQRFHGIPYLHSTAPIAVPQLGKHFETPLGRIAGSIVSKEDYSFSMYPAVEVEVVVDDLPLASFAQAKAEFEKRIKAGYIREVYSVRLGYLAYQNPNNLGNDFILLPIWELCGSIVDEPRFDPPVPMPGQEELPRITGGQEALVNAQTGIIIDPKDGRAEVRWANIITWD